MICDPVTNINEKIFFTQIPNIIDFIDLTPYAYRLYGHLKTIAGYMYQNEINQSEDTLASICRFSTGKISYAKKELEKKGLINIYIVKTDRGNKHVIKVVNIEKQNFDFLRKIKEAGLPTFSSKNIEPTSKNKRIINQSPKRKKENKELPQNIKTNNIEKFKTNYSLDINWLDQITANNNKQKENNKKTIDFYSYKEVSSSINKDKEENKKNLEKNNMSVKPSYYETEEYKDLKNININNNLLLNEDKKNKEIFTHSEESMINSNLSQNIDYKEIDKKFYFENLDLWNKSKTSTKGISDFIDLLKENRAKLGITYLDDLNKLREEKINLLLSLKEKKEKSKSQIIENKKLNTKKIKQDTNNNIPYKNDGSLKSIKEQRKEEYEMAKKTSSKEDRNSIRKYLESRFKSINFAIEGRWIILLTAKYSVKNIIDFFEYLYQNNKNNINWKVSCNFVYKNIDKYNELIKSNTNNSINNKLNQKTVDKDISLTQNNFYQNENYYNNFKKSVNNIPFEKKIFELNSKMGKTISDLENKKINNLLNKERI